GDKAMSKILLTGSAGFIGGYLVEELLSQGHSVVGLDNYSKYGKTERSYDDHPQFTGVVGDAADPKLMYELLDGCDCLVAGAAYIGVISYFHAYAYDLMAEYELIYVSAMFAAIPPLYERPLL